VYFSYLIMLCAIATRDHTGVPTTRAEVLYQPDYKGGFAGTTHKNITHHNHRHGQTRLLQ
jgi:hypothetical protein